MRRTVYHILGKPDVREEEGRTVVENSQSSHDMHLKDYDEEIYDDDDFYHQVNECASCSSWIMKCISCCP